MQRGNKVNFATLHAPVTYLETFQKYTQIKMRIIIIDKVWLNLLERKSLILMNPTP